MKKWFMNLTTEQQKKAYVFSIVISVLLFYAIALSTIFALPWGAALAAVIIERKIIKQAKKDAAADQQADRSDPCESSEEGAANEVADDAVPSPVYTFKITDEAVYESEDQKTVRELDHVDFGKPAGTLGCYLNYTPYALRLPTENQLRQLNELGVVVPDGATVEDAGWMIKRAAGRASRPECPEPSMVALALGLNIQFSAFITASGLFRAIVDTPNKRDRAALYAYAVRQYMRGEPFQNMLEDPDVKVFYSFADQVVKDPVLIRSLEGRSSDDFIKPYRGTAIYKAASSYLNDIKGVKL